MLGKNQNKMLETKNVIDLFSYVDNVFPFQTTCHSLLKMNPYSCVFSCATIKQRNDTLGNDVV